MGLSYNFSMTGNTYFAIDSVEHDDYNFAKYTNTSGGTKRLTSLTLYLGTGNGTYTAGQTVTGNGGRIPLRIYCNRIGSSTYSDANITTVMGVASGGWPTGTYGTYKFSFQNPVTVSAGGTVQFWWEFRGSTSRSLALCLDADRGYVTESEPNYTVTFDLAGGTRTGGGALVQSVPPGGSATPPTCSRSGYTFAGWNGSYTNVTSNRTITAKWTANTYTVTYNANGGTGAPASQTKVYGQNLTLSSTIPTRNQCKFRTWNSRSDGTGTNYSPGSIYSANAPITLYAIWDYAVTRHGNGGFIQIYDPHEEIVMVENEQGELVEETITVDYRNVETATAYVAHGGSYTIPNEYVSINVDPDQSAGQTFQGWSTTSSGSVQYQNGQTLTITNVTNLYAIFKTKSYTVTFVDGFGINSKSFTVQHGQTSPLPDGTASGTTDVTTSNKWVQDHWAKHNGYTFTGWLGNYKNVTSDRTITALWGFTPVWIMKNGQWVAYRAREED